MADIISAVMSLGFPEGVAAAVVAVVFGAVAVSIFDLSFGVIRLVLKKL